MKRKTSRLPTRLYKYALMPPTVNAELVSEQLRLARSYRDALIEIELQARAAYRKARWEIAELRELDERIAAHVAQLEQARAELAHARRRAAVQAPTARVSELRAALRELRSELRLHKPRFSPLLQTAVRQIRADTVAAIKRARKSSGLYWGTYLLVEQAVESIHRSRRGPRLRPWDGRGSVGVQLSGGLTAAALFGFDRRIRIEPIPDDTFAHAGRSYRTKHRLTTLHLRVGSSEAGRPIWASWPLILERPLPQDGTVKSAWVTRRFVATHVKWELCVAVEAASFIARPRRTQQQLAASVHFGWRQTERGLRVAYVCTTDGATQEILLPQRFVERVDECERLAATRARERSAARDALAAYIASHDVPSWLADGVEHLSESRSRARLVALALEWRDRRHAGDDAAYAALEAWRKRDRRLLEWQVNSRDKGYLHRREHYRLVGLDLARRYATLVLDDTDFRSLSRRRGRDDESPMPQAARRNRTLAACGELRDILRYMAEKHGSRAVPVSAHGISKTCHACGCACGPVRVDRIQHTCQQCGASWDVDANAARNLLGRAAPTVAAE